MPIHEVDRDNRSQLQQIADVIARSRKAVVITGAGISTNCGIPDFRSEQGLYSLIQSQYDTAKDADILSSTPPSSQESISSCSSTSSTSRLPSNVKGRDLFDSLVWSDPLSTSVFYRFIASLRRTIREDVRQTTATHRLIRALRDGGRLVRCYTQNIDGLEAREGLCTSLERGRGNRARFLKRNLGQPRPDGPIIPGSQFDGGCEVVQLHGDLTDLRCGLCNHLCSWDADEREAYFLGGEAPVCENCVDKNDDRTSRGKRGLALGRLRPNVVLYGEEHPAAHLLSPITTHDLGLAPDTLLILGTSLRVHGLKVLVKEFAKSVHSRGRGKGKVIFVNQSKPSDSVWTDVIDYWVDMDCDEWVQTLKECRSDIWERQGMIRLPVTKPGPAKQRPEGREESVAAKHDGDKENACVAPVEPNKTKSMRTAVEGSASRPSRATIKPRAPKSQKKAPLQRTSTSGLNSQPLAAFSTPRKPKALTAEVKTPPSSGKKSNTAALSALSLSPSKRRRETQDMNTTDKQVQDSNDLPSPSKCLRQGARRNATSVKIWTDTR